MKGLEKGTHPSLKIGQKTNNYVIISQVRVYDKYVIYDVEPLTDVPYKTVKLQLR